MGLLQGLVDIADQRVVVHVFFQVDLPEAAVQVIGRVLAPQLQDHLRRFGRHGAIEFRIDLVQLQVRRYASWAEAEVEPPVREMVHKGQARGHVGGMVIGQAGWRGTEPDGVGHGQRLADEGFGQHDVFVLHGVVFADPELGETQFLAAHDQF